MFKIIFLCSCWVAVEICWQTYMLRLNIVCLLMQISKPTWSSAFVWERVSSRHGSAWTEEGIVDIAHLVESEDEIYKIISYLKVLEWHCFGDCAFQLAAKNENDLRKEIRVFLMTSLGFNKLNPAFIGAPGYSCLDSYLLYLLDIRGSIPVFKSITGC